MANKVYDYYNGLPAWAKGVTIVGGLGIAYIIGSKIYKAIAEKAKNKTILEESESAGADLLDLQQQGINPTLSDTQIDSIINSLVEAMNDCGTDENAVLNQFKILNNIADVYLLINRWKIRYYRPCAAYQPISYAKWLWDDKAFGENLSTWLTYDLTASEINKINNILSEKGIEFKF
jgi:hypothetical protein